ncbi:MAG: FprA family A-type flavoprotein [Lachnospiraceae bacterium]|nr:FprA family A-type flavoprotein [Lachnospiraceae bacterium]
MTIASDVKFIGVNDHAIDLFEGMYEVPKGMSYNSYVILDEKVAIMDTVGEGFTGQWLQNMKSVLENRRPDYLIVQHMEPDHSANILNFAREFPKAQIVASAKAFAMMENFFGTDFAQRRIVVSDGDMLSLGKHKLKFVAAPMVHWPEVIVTYDSTEKILFSADAFGKFGALDVEEDWLDEARRYYIGIVGRYGAQVQSLLKKVAVWDIRAICPLHGPVLRENLEYYLEKYNTWSSYKPEEEGIVIAYTSVYGNTQKAVMLLKEKLREKGCPKVVVADLARCDMSQAVALAFKYGSLVLATTVYNGDVFPPMGEFIHWLIERNFANRRVAFAENYSWSPMAAKVMKEKFEKSKGLTFAETSVRIASALNAESIAQIEALAEELCREY